MKNSKTKKHFFLISLSLTAAISLLNCFCCCTNKTSYKIQTLNGKFFSSNTGLNNYDDLLENNKVLLCVIDHFESLKFNDYKNTDFMLDDIVKIEDFTSAYNGRDDLNSSFCRILGFDFSNCSIEYLLKSFDVLKNDSRVKTVEFSSSGSFYYTPNDPKFQAVFPESQCQYYLHKISIPSAWDIETGSSNVKIGLIDTGVYISNADFNTTRFPQALSYDACELGRSPFIPNQIHGTMTAGIIAATTNNNYLISGMCSNIEIATIRADDPYRNGDETIPGICRALNFATLHNIPILNFSGGFSSSNLLSSDVYYSPYSIDNGQALKQAIQNYNGLLVVAAGNDSLNLTTSPEKCYPTCWSLPNVISVGSSTSSDTKFDSSNYSDVYVDLFAPGDDILSLCGDSLNIGDGNSYSAPQVAACAALILSKYPSMSTLEIKNTILQNVDQIDGLENHCITGGRLNCYQSLINPIFQPHPHSYNDHYSSSTKYKHKAYCYCGDYRMENHVWDFGTTWYNSQGLLNGYCAFCGGTMII